MGIKRGYEKQIILLTSVFFTILFSSTLSHARMITQLTPQLTITEEYSDNYFQTKNNKLEEYITSYGLGFSVGFLEKTKKMVFAYNPKYKDYQELDDRDGFEHIASFDGEFNPSKRTSINTHVYYTSASDDDNEEEFAGDTWENTAQLIASHQLSKNTDLAFSQSYTHSFDQDDRTGDYKEHTVNSTFGEVTNQFGPKDTMGFNFLYEFDDYNSSDEDEYTKYRPSAFFTYWMDPLNGLDSNISYENKEFDDSSNDIETYEGYIRYLRKFSKHFDGYLKYRHYYSDEDSGDHTIYHPSAGFDWQVSEDSRVSLGLGVLFQEWENQDDSVDPFLDLDAYKTFNFSRGSLTIVGASGYESSTGEDINEGFSTYYQAGLDLNYQLLKRLSYNLYSSCRFDDYQGDSNGGDDDTITYLAGFSLNHQILKDLSANLYGSYDQTEYHEETGDRTDEETTIGAGLSWSPLRWLRFNASYSYTDFQTDSSERDEYRENKATFSVSFIPARPVKFETSAFEAPLEDKLFNY